MDRASDECDGIAGASGTLTPVISGQEWFSFAFQKHPAKVDQD